MQNNPDKHISDIDSFDFYARLHFATIFIATMCVDVDIFFFLFFSFPPSSFLFPFLACQSESEQQLYNGNEL